MELNKIDRMVRDMLLRFPTLYANRFDAFAEIMTNSCYEWDGSELVYIMPQEEPVTTETMLNIFRGKLAESREKNGPARTPDCLVKLHTQFLTDDERHLHDAEFVAANIDTYATTWCGTTYKQTWLWLFSQHRHGINPYWAINRKPEVVDEEWRLAIKDWLRQLMPAANSMMGMFVEVDGGPRGHWQALPGQRAEASVRRVRLAGDPAPYVVNCQCHAGYTGRRVVEVVYTGYRSNARMMFRVLHQFPLLRVGL